MSDYQWPMSVRELDVWTVCTAFAIVSAVTLLWWLGKGRSGKTEYHERVRRRLEEERKRRELLAKQLTVDGQLMTEQRQLIVQFSMTQLIEQLQSGNITASEALWAYQAKALEVTKLYNCITEFVLNAKDRAAALDALPASERGPLHGVPISVKECIDLEGFDCTLGLAKNLGEPSTTTAPLLQTLVDLGAVPFCKTNVPQTLFSFGCGNPVWGVTRNIVDPVRVPGGSSGGEGCLVAAGGSLLGLGSDLGGSARVPALFSGCCGFKPTSGRFSCAGQPCFMPSTTGIVPTIGLLARQPADVARVVRLLTTPLPTADMYRLDPTVPRAYWNEQLAAGGRRWRIGYLTELPVCPATPGVRRVLTQTVQALEAAGHELVPFQLDFGPAEFQLYLQCCLPENGIFAVKVLADEEEDISIQSVMKPMKLPFWLRRVMGWATQGRYRFLPSRMKAFTSGMEQATLVRAGQDQYVQDTVARWRSARLDLLVLPGFACPPPPREMIAPVNAAGLYTMVMNLLNFTAGILTVDRETEEDQAALESYPTSSVELRWIKESTKGAVGQPLGIQVAALPWMEEQLLAGMQDIEQAIKKHYSK